MRRRLRRSCRLGGRLRLRRLLRPWLRRLPAQLWRPLGRRPLRWLRLWLRWPAQPRWSLGRGALRRGTRRSSRPRRGRHARALLLGACPTVKLHRHHLRRLLLDRRRRGTGGLLLAGLLFLSAAEDLLKFLRP